MTEIQADAAITEDAEQVFNQVIEGDRAFWRAHAHIDKWHRSEDHDAGLAPDEQLDVPGNLLVNVGIQRMLDLLIVAGGQGYNATHCRVGVGDSATAATAADTDLNAATNKRYNLCDSVNRSSQTVTIVATFGTSDANFVWNEWVIDVGTASSGTVTTPILNHKVASMGTKASGATWVITVTITIS